ncbi:MAG: 5-formyltetrahydrofolate cyclo-ligase [Verrucomicrobiota bacterium]|jgi:5-formyltetrahydrofolate cyclo-ligase
MTSDNAPLKRELRSQLRAWLRDVSPARRAEMSARARDLLAGQRVWREAGRVLFYAPLPDEIDLLPLLGRALAEGKTIGLPRFERETGVYGAARITDFARDCAAGKFGALEPSAHCAPIPPNLLDLALVPGLGFDAGGHRLGRGGGFYDRLLAGVAGTRCGVAFDEQIRPRIPAEAHDIILNCILTPTQWLETSGRPPAVLP